MEVCRYSTPVFLRCPLCGGSGYLLVPCLDHDREGDYLLVGRVKVKISNKKKYLCYVVVLAD